MMYTDLVQQVKTDYDAARAKMARDGKSALDKLFKQFFDDLPDLQSVSFKGYTCYFNDGDSTYYSVSEPQFGFSVKTLVDEDGDGDEYEELDEEENCLYDEPSDWVRKNYPNDKAVLAYDQLVKELGQEEVERRGKLVEDFRSAFSMIPQEVFETTFGDHKSYFYTRQNGLEVEDYTDHD